MSSGLPKWTRYVTVNVEVPDAEVGPVEARIYGKIDSLWAGVKVDSEGKLYIVSPAASPEIGRPKVYDTTVALAGTENTHDVNTDLGRNGGGGYIVNDGPGDLHVRISDDGTNFMGGAATGSSEYAVVEKDEVLDLKGLTVDTLKIDASVDATAYRILVI